MPNGSTVLMFPGSIHGRNFEQLSKVTIAVGYNLYNGLSPWLGVSGCAGELARSSVALLTSYSFDIFLFHRITIFFDNRYHMVFMEAAQSRAKRLILFGVSKLHNNGNVIWIRIARPNAI